MNGRRQEFDSERLTSYLTKYLEDDVVETALVEVGLNRIIRVSTPDDRDAYVVRQPNKDRNDAGFVDIATEHAAMERLKATNVPAPNAVHYCADESVLGTAFSVIEYVEGEGLHWDEPLPEEYRNESSHERVGKLLIDTLADLHSLDTAAFAEVCEPVCPQEQVSRTISQLKTATSETGHTSDTLYRVADWLQANVPTRATRALVHGDYKPDNVFLTRETELEVSAVVDWETVMLRDPRTELGYFLFYWREATDTAPALDDLESRYPQSVMTDIYKRERDGFWPFTKKSGSLSRQELVDRWERSTGLTYEDDRFYRTFGAFMLATVWEGLYADALERGEDTTSWKAHIEYVAEIAEMIASGNMPL